MAQGIKALVAKLDDLSSILGTSMMEGKNLTPIYIPLHTFLDILKIKSF